MADNLFAANKELASREVELRKNNIEQEKQKQALAKSEERFHTMASVLLTRS